MALLAAQTAARNACRVSALLRRGSPATGPGSCDAVHVPGEPASAHRFDVLRVVASVSAIGVVVDLAWVVMAPPRSFRWWAPVVIVVIGVAVSVALGRLRHRFPTAQRHAGVAFAVLWSWLWVGWILAFPGMRHVVGVYVFGSAAVLGLLVVVAMCVAGMRDYRTDSLCGLAILVITLLVTVPGFDALRTAGLRVRLEIVLSDYETAIRAGAVEQSGGFTWSRISGWIWVDALVLDPYAAVLHDPSDDIDERGPGQFLGPTGENIVECTRLRREWFWCTLE